MTPDKGAVPSRHRLPLRVGALLVAAVAAGLLFVRLAGGATVEVAAPARGLAVAAVYATGTVESSVTVRIAPQISGRIVELLADEGQSVKAGGVLARLDDSDLRASVAELEARAKYAEQQFERVEALLKQGWVTREKFDQTRTELDAAHHTLRRASEQMRFMALTTPADGLVIRRDGEVGDFVPSNQPVFYLAKAGAPLRISAEVDEEDIPVVKAGNKVLIRADAFPDRVFEGQVSEITPKGDPVARSYRVRVALPEDTALKIGMTAETNIIAKESPNALLVPATAVVGGAVWTVRGGRLARLPVQIGVKGRDRIEIASGLTEGDAVVVKPGEGFKEGERVRTAVVKSAIPPGEAQRSAR
ncbi:MAG: efflux RND transporter periplasmic adaptor subunit [Rhodomicrobium sp.]